MISFSIHILTTNYFFAKTLLPSRFFFDVSFLLLTTVMLVLVFIVFYLFYYLNRTSKKTEIVRLYSDIISEIILCETDEELKEVIAQLDAQKIITHWFAEPVGRKILIQELVKIHKTISGKGADNIRWMYEHFGLVEDSLNDLASHKWHRKAVAIQQLAEMKQIKYLTKIYKATNSKNKWIRTEAQIAVVKLTGFKGLRFLNIISHPISQWQQLCLLRELVMDHEYSSSNLKSWLCSTNDSVVEFTLRLIKKFMCFELQKEVVGCLYHKADNVREAAISTLTEIAADETPWLLQERFASASRKEKLLILSVLKERGVEEQGSFFRDLLCHEDTRIKTAARAALMRIAESASNIYNLPNGVEQKADVA